MSTILLLSALVPLAFVILPHVDRYLRLAQLVSADPVQRQNALKYVVLKAGDHPRVAAGAVECLVDADDAQFLEIVTALDLAGVWDRKHVADEQWQRWLTVMSVDPQAEARILAGQLAAKAADLACDPHIIALLERLLDDPEADVRFNALVASAELSAASVARQSYKALIASRSHDEESAIARHAWIILGLLGQVEPVTAQQLREAPLVVAEAMLWADVKARPDAASVAMEVLRDVSGSAQLRAAAAYALHLSRRPVAIDAMLEVLEQRPVQHGSEDLILAWRCILSLPKPDPTRKEYTRVENALSPFADVPQPGSALEPLTLAAIYRFGIVGLNDRPRHDPFSVLVRLATVEGQSGPDMYWPVVEGTPDLLRVMSTAVGRKPKSEPLIPVFASQQASLRDLTCVVAADRIHADELGDLVQQLLIDYDDRRKMSGAILSGLTAAHPQLLERKAEAEDIWAVRQIMLLGQWMQGKLPEMDSALEGLLTRTDLPTTTVLLTMLHRGGRFRIQALDYLLNPRGEPVIDLIELFDQQRWWYVLTRYLPEDAPPIWVWADPQLESFQLDVLRNWYLVNRYRMAKDN